MSNLFVYRLARRSSTIYVCFATTMREPNGMLRGAAIVWAGLGMVLAAVIPVAFGPQQTWQWQNAVIVARMTFVVMS